MTEPELVFDPSLKKKKKKTVEIKDDEADEEEPKEDEDLNFSKKKKKKKPALDLGGDIKESELGEPPALDFGVKKKKKDKNLIIEPIGADEAEDDAINEDESSKDFTYDELLQRVFDLMREKNPEMMTGERKKLIMKPPLVARVGTKKTMFINFDEICRQLRRAPRHLLSFLFAELGTNGSLDGNSQLIIKGRYQVKHIENVLRSYIKEYVMCHTCRSTDTELSKDIRLFFLECKTCGSKCSVVSIKSGFQAVTGKRAALRAKVT